MNIFHSLPRNVFQQLSTILVAYLCRYNQNNTSVKYASPQQGRSDVQRWKACRRGAGPHACPIVIGGTTTDYCREETWQAQPTCASRPRPSRVRVNSSFAPIKESATYLHRKGERTIEMHRSFWEFLRLYSYNCNLRVEIRTHVRHRKVLLHRGRLQYYTDAPARPSSPPCSAHSFPRSLFLIIFLVVLFDLRLVISQGRN